MSEVNKYVCPYEVLGVGRDVDQKEIKRRFRILSKKHHPDAGGDHKTYAQITWAYSILKDEEKRKQYDKGEHVGKHTKEQKAYGLIGHIFTEMLNSEGDKIFYVDVVERIERYILKGLHNMKTELNKIKKEEDRIDKLRKRIICKDNRANVFESTLSERQAGIRQKRKNIENEKVVYELALEKLDQYAFEHEIGRPGSGSTTHIYYT